jgi:hypothetical protein
MSRWRRPSWMAGAGMQKPLSQPANWVSVQGEDFVSYATTDPNGERC